MVNLDNVILGILKGTYSESSGVRKVSLEACRKLSSFGRMASPEIAKELKKMAASTIPEAIQAVGLTAVPDEGILANLQRLTEHADLEIKVAAITAMGDYMLPFMMEMIAKGRQQQQQQPPPGNIVIPQVGMPPVRMQ